jgi:glycosyltransferase involved in cell wall biosynthesis
MDAVSELQGCDADTTVQSGVLGQLILRQLPRVHDQQVLHRINQTEPRVWEPSHRSRASRSNSLDGMSGVGQPPEQGKRYPRFLPQKKHVLMVTSSLARGGCERQILATANGLVREGYRIEVFCLAPPVPEPNFMEEFSQLGITCRHVADSIPHVNGGQNVQSLTKFAQLVDHLDILAAARALGRAIEEFRPEIVHCWSDFANVIGGLVSTKVVLAQRNMPVFPYIDGPEPYTCREAYRLLALNSLVSMLNHSLAGRVGYAKWLKVPSDTINVVYNGYLPSCFHIRQRSETKACRRHLGVFSDAPLVGAVMRFAPEKDPILWLETAAVIAAARPDARFVLAGYGELAGHVRQRIQSLGLNERFILPGATKDVGLIYAALDVFLLTSRSEGSPNVLTEAQAAGIPVVTPDVGGAGETLLDGTTGIVVGSRRPLNLANAVLQILNDPSWRERAASHGPAFVSTRFGHQRMINETIHLYNLRNDGRRVVENNELGAASSAKLHRPVSEL